LPTRWRSRAAPSVAALALLAGCAGSETTYSTNEVHRALRKHGLRVDVVCADRQAQTVGCVTLDYAGAPEGVVGMVADKQGTAVGATVYAYIFETTGDAEAAERGGGVREANVLVVSRGRHDEVRAALDSLDDG
jgi:hypothetical protein